jgi:tRNA-Thr(GGU) m(6)t(6)A37 methyltransferase TsaA
MSLHFEEITFRPIGIIYTEYKKPEGVPIQAVSSKKNATIEIFPEFAEGLIDIEGFSHIILLYYFHLTKEDRKLKVKPYLDLNTHGIFATRAPLRPNRIGLSIVRLIKRDDVILTIEGVDIVDQTPLIDIKPFVPQYDVSLSDISQYKIGWLTDLIQNTNKTASDGRFGKEEFSL